MKKEELLAVCREQETLIGQLRETLQEQGDWLGRLNALVRAQEEILAFQEAEVARLNGVIGELRAGTGSGEAESATPARPFRTETGRSAEPCGTSTETRPEGWPAQLSALRGGLARLESELKRSEAELARSEAATAPLSARLDEWERSLGAGTGDPDPASACERMLKEWLAGFFSDLEKSLPG